MHNKMSKSKMNLIISLVAILLIAVIVIIAVVVSGGNKTTPVSDEYVNVTVEADYSATFRLTKNNFSVLEVSTLNKTDAFLTQNITNLLPFKQASSLYLKNLKDANRLGTTAKDIILFTVESRSEEDFTTLCTTFKETLKENGSEALVYCLYIKVKEEGIEKLASDNSVSYAKAYLCHKIAAQSDKDEKELVKLSIPEIINSIVKKPSAKTPEQVIEEANKEQRETVIENDESSKEATTDTTTTSSAATSATPSETASGTVSETVSENTPSENPSSTYSRHTVSYVVSNDDESGWLPGLW